jgi:hypothetical protein
MNDQNTEQNQGSTAEHDVDHVIMMPNIEEGVSIPKNSKEAMPEMSMEHEINVRAETVKTMADLKGEPIEPTEEEQKKAVDLVKEMMTNPMFKPEYGNYSDPTMAFLAGIVAQSQVLLVRDYADYKLYVVNNLVKIIESTKNPKEKTTALRALGEVDGVDAFKKKTEVTHKLESMEEVEKELLSMLSELKQKGLIKPPAQTIDVEEIKDE